MVAFQRSQEEMNLLSNSVEAAKRSVYLSVIQHREGMVDYQRVLSAQRFHRKEQNLLTSTSVAIWCLILLARTRRWGRNFA